MDGDDEDDWIAQPVQSSFPAAAAGAAEDEDVAFFNGLVPPAASAKLSNGTVPPSPPPLFSSCPGGDAAGGASFFDELASPAEPPPPLAAGPTPRRAKAREDAAYFEQLRAEVGGHDPARPPPAQTAAPPSPTALASSSSSPAFAQTALRPLAWASASASDECFFDELGGSPRGTGLEERLSAAQGGSWDVPAPPSAAGSGDAAASYFEEVQPELGGHSFAEPAPLLNARISLSAGIGPGPAPGTLSGYAEQAACEDPLAEAHASEAAQAQHYSAAVAGGEETPAAAANAALPVGWVSGYSPEGYLYFYNLHSGESSWVHPAGAEAPLLPPSAAQAEPDVWQAQAQAEGAAWQTSHHEQPAAWEAPAQAVAGQGLWQAAEPAGEPHQAAWAQPQFSAQPEVANPQPWAAPQVAAPPAGGYGSVYLNAPAVAAPSVDPARLAHGRPPCPAVCFGFDGTLVTCHPGGAAYGGLGMQAGPVRVRPLAQLLRAAGGAGAAFLAEAEALAVRPGFGSSGGLAGLAGIAARAPSLPDLARVSEERGAAEAALLPAPASSLLLWGILRLMCTHKGNMGSDGAGPPLLQLLLDPACGVDEQPPPSPLQAAASLVPQTAAMAAVEAERLLLCGQRVEALAAMVRGGLWGPALLLAPSCGERAHAETAAACLQSGLLPGTALHTSLSLAAGLPGLAGGVPGDGASRALYLHCWRRNLAALLASRAAGDGAAMVALGDTLWAERRDVAAAHACYLLAGVAPSPLGSPGARMCLVGADHGQHPRTFATPTALLRTELLEAALRGANSQAALPCLHPYRLAHAALLAELGRLREALAWVDMVQRGLRAGGVGGGAASQLNAPLVAALATQLEERLRAQASGPARGAAGAGVQAASKMLLGGLTTLLDRGMSTIFGAEEGAEGAAAASDASRAHPQLRAGVPDFASAAAASAPAPTASAPAPPVAQPEAQPARASPAAQAPPVEAESGVGGGMVRSISSMFFRPRRNEAKLGDSNKFVFDEELKMWVEEGKPRPAPAQPLAPPPTNFPPPEAQSGPPGGAPPTDFSARAQGGGVRSRYVDTFNTAGAQASLAPPPAPVDSFGLAPRPLPSARPAFFVPGATAAGASVEGPRPPMPATVAATVDAGLQPYSPAAQGEWANVTL